MTVNSKYGTIGSAIPVFKRRIEVAKLIRYLGEENSISELVQLASAIEEHYTERIEGAKVREVERE